MNSSFAVRQFLPEVLAAMQHRGFDAVVAAPQPAEPAAFRASFPGVEFRHVPMKREISLLSDIRSLCRLWFLLRSVRPALTNMSTPKMGLIGGLAAWLARVPHRIYTLRGLRYETARSWKRKLLITCEKIACACAHQVICISRSVRQTAILEGLAPAGKLVLLGDRVSEGVTIEAEPETRGSDLVHLRKQLGIPQEAAVIGFVGRLTRDKGVCELVQCFQILQREGRAVHLLLLGDFESGDPVDRKTVEWISTNSAAHWLGFVPNPKPYYRLMSAFVFPTYREGLGKVLLEAAAAGAPVVSTTVTGVVDIVQDGLTGILVPPGDAPALARAVGRLLDEPETAARMARAAQSMIREHFDNSVYLARLGEMIESLAAADRTPERRQPVQEVRRR
ncbi:MAG: glycosyltransferase family 4 protein [Bryobacteraceae bacterium]